MSTITEKQVLPLLSESLYNELKCIANSSACAVSKTLVEAFETQRAEIPDTHRRFVPLTDFCTMMTIRVNEGQVELSYLPKGREPVYSDSGKWSQTNRQVGKPGKIVSALLECMSREEEQHQIKFKNKWCVYQADTNIISYPTKESVEYHVLSNEEFEEATKRVVKVTVKRYTDKQYEEFSNNLKSFYESDIEFKLVQGEDIAKYYHYDTYFKGKGGRGTLWESCMRGMHSDVFELYVKSPNCHLLVALKDTLVVARALVWNTDKGMFMDRVYFYEDFYFNVMKEHAEKERWMYKAAPNSAINTDIMKPLADGTYTRTRMPKMKIKDMYTGNDAYFPYLDTFKLLNYEQGILHNSYDLKWTYELEAAGGHHSNVSDSDDYEKCEYSDAYYHSSRLVDVERYGNVHISHTVVDYENNRRVREDCVRLFDGRWSHEDDENLVLLSTEEIRSESGEVELIHKWALKDQCEEFDINRETNPKAYWTLTEEASIAGQALSEQIVAAEEAARIERDTNMTRSDIREASLSMSRPSRGSEGVVEEAGPVLTRVDWASLGAVDDLALGDVRTEAVGPAPIPMAELEGGDIRMDIDDLDFDLDTVTPAPSRRRLPRLGTPRRPNGLRTGRSPDDARDVGGDTAGPSGVEGESPETVRGDGGQATDRDARWSRLGQAVHEAVENGLRRRSNGVVVPAPDLSRYVYDDFSSFYRYQYTTSRGAQQVEAANLDSLSDSIRRIRESMTQTITNAVPPGEVVVIDDMTADLNLDEI